MDTVPKTVTSDAVRELTPQVASITAVVADAAGNNDVAASVFDESIAIVDIIDDTLIASPGHPVAAGTPDKR